MTVSEEVSQTEVTHEDIRQSQSRCHSGLSEESPSGQSRMSAKSCTGDYIILPFGFHSKNSHEASKDLLTRRCKLYKPKEEPQDDDIWKKPPPDFRPQNFEPKPPKRNSRDSQMPWKYGTFPGHGGMMRRPKVVHIPHVLRAKTEDEGRFVTHFPEIPDSFEAKMESCKSGLNKPGPYDPPKLHDYRGYPPLAKLGLPEFQLRFEKDPYNIHFHTRNLNQIHGLNTRPLSGSQHHGIQMAPPKTPQPEWEARLILPKQPWPTKDGSYTRYRRMGRSPHSALLDRVEDALTAQWAKDELEKQLQKQQSAKQM